MQEKKLFFVVLRTQRNSSFSETLLATYKRAQIKNSGFEKERQLYLENNTGWVF